MSLLEIVAVAVSFLGIWLTARRKLLCWPVNLTACALYFKLFLDVRLYADMVLQALFGAAILYGWTVWARGREQSGEIVVRPLSMAQAGKGLAVGAVAAVAFGWLTMGQVLCVPMVLLGAGMIAWAYRREGASASA